LLLDKSERDLEERNKRIEILEKLIVSLGGQVPSSNDEKDIDKKFKEV